MEKNPSFTPIEVSNKLTKKKCFKCSSYGNLQADFPNRRILSNQEIGEIDELVKEVEESKEWSDDFQEEETHIEADEGEILILRRILYTHKSSLNKEQQEMIFHSRFTINNKVGNLIIDGESCTNVASTILV